MTGSSGQCSGLGCVWINALRSVKVKVLIRGLLRQRSNIAVKWLPSWPLHNGILIGGMFLCKTFSQLPRTFTVDLNMVWRPWVGCFYLSLRPVFSLGTVFISEIQSCWCFSSSTCQAPKLPPSSCPRVFAYATPSFWNFLSSPGPLRLSDSWPFF